MRICLYVVHFRDANPFVPGGLVVPDGDDGVLDGLVAQRVDGRDEEVESGDQRLAYKRRKHVETLLEISLHDVCCTPLPHRSSLGSSVCPSCRGTPRTAPVTGWPGR